MTDKRRGVRLGRIHVLLLLVVASIGASAWQRGNDAPVVVVRYVVDPAWPGPVWSHSNPVPWPNPAQAPLALAAGGKEHA